MMHDDSQPRANTRQAHLSFGNERQQNIVMKQSNHPEGLNRLLQTQRLPAKCWLSEMVGCGQRADSMNTLQSQAASLTSGMFIVNHKRTGMIILRQVFVLLQPPLQYLVSLLLL